MISTRDGGAGIRLTIRASGRHGDSRSHDSVNQAMTKPCVTSIPPRSATSPAAARPRHTATA
jgi:hypothetical protein